MSIKLLSELNWKEVSELDKEKTLCVIPISSIEQHGIHLPLGTDDIILDIAINSLKNKRSNDEEIILILPSLKYGKSIEHLKFPGTITLKSTTLISIIEDIIFSLSYNGFNKFLVLNSHGGNTSLLRSLAQDLRFEHDVKIYNVDLWASDFFTDLTFIKTNVYNDVHAGEIETSLLMNVKPELVKTNLSLKDELKTIANLNSYDFSWLSSDISQTGIIGDATFATKETGEKLVEFISNKLTIIFEKIF